jgi:hypothetical protein
MKGKRCRSSGTSASKYHYVCCISETQSLNWSGNTEPISVKTGKCTVVVHYSIGRTDGCDSWI